MDRYYDVAHRMAQRVLPDPDAADDVCHDAFVRVFRYAHSFDRQRAFPPWLRMIIVRLANDYYTAHRLEESMDGYAPWLRIPDPHEDADDRVDTEARINDAIARLNSADREFILFYMLFELSAADMADHYGISEGAVGVRKHRILKKLRESPHHD